MILTGRMSQFQGIRDQPGTAIHACGCGQPASNYGALTKARKERHGMDEGEKRRVCV